MDDEDEMASLRADARYLGNRKSADGPLSKEEEEMTRCFLPTSFGQKKSTSPRKDKQLSFAAFAIPRREKQSAMTMAVIGRRGMKPARVELNLPEEDSPHEPLPPPPNEPLPLPPDEPLPLPPDEPLPLPPDEPLPLPPDEPLPQPPKKTPLAPPFSAPTPSLPSDAVPSDDSDSEETLLPITHEVVLSAHTKTVTALAVDKHGANMVTGSMDGMLRFWDFQGMNRGMKPYREFVPKENHSIQALDFNERGNMILCITSDVHCRIYDREGSQTPLEITVLGDMYVRDMAVTTGHTKMLTDGMWHPKNSEVWISSSYDGTIRIWNLNGKKTGMDSQLMQTHVLKIVDHRGVAMGATGKSATGNEGVYPTTCRYALDGRIFAGCSDGSIQIFHEKARYVKADKIIRGFHTMAVTCVYPFADRMISRSLDGTMKYWDTSAPMNVKKAPLLSWSDLPTECVYTRCVACPDAEYAVTGTCTKDGKDEVKIFSLRTANEECSLPSPGATRFHWCPQINHIIVGNVKGGVALKYNPRSSRGGALEFLSKEEKKNVKSIIDSEVGYVPMAIPADDKEAMAVHGINLRRDGSMTELSQRQRLNRAKREKEGANPGKSTKPPEDGGPAIKMSMRTKSYLETFGVNEATRGDAQKNLLSMSEDTGIDDYLLRAYVHTQPEKMLDYSHDESEGDQLLKGKHCPKCGKRLCSCGFMTQQESDAKRQKT